METNINENVLSNELALIVEDLEEVVAPGSSFNHNEVELTVEELEEILARAL